MVELLEGIATTRAIRRFRPDRIPDDDLATIMFAATRAPSGSNRQPFRFIVLRDGPKANDAKALLGEAFRRGWNSKQQERSYDSPAAERQARAMQHFVDNFEQIPVVVLACLVRYRQPVPTEGGSVYPACQNLLLGARALGYGGVLTQWHAFVEQPLRDLLAIPDGVAIHATIPLGKPIGRHGPVRRRPLHTLVYDDGWEESASWATEPPNLRQ
jgi:nitroreductase